MSDRNTRISALFEQHAPRLIVYARRQAGPADAEDLVSEAFVVALRRLDDLPSESGETFAWLVGTVRRLAANHRRRQDTQNRYWREAVRAGWHASGSPEDTVADRERCLAALAELSTADRELLLLVAWEGLTAEQAASVLGISRNTLAVRTFRARRRLDDHLRHSPTLRAVTTKD